MEKNKIKLENLIGVWEKELKIFQINDKMIIFDSEKKQLIQSFKDYFDKTFSVGVILNVLHVYLAHLAIRIIN